MLSASSSPSRASVCAIAPSVSPTFAAVASLEAFACAASWVSESARCLDCPNVWSTEPTWPLMSVSCPPCSFVFSAASASSASPALALDSPASDDASPAIGAESAFCSAALAESSGAFSATIACFSSDILSACLAWSCTPRRTSSPSRERVIASSASATPARDSAIWAPSAWAPASSLAASVRSA